MIPDTIIIFKHRTVGPTVVYSTPIIVLKVPYCVDWKGIQEIQMTKGIKATPRQKAAGKKNLFKASVVRVGRHRNTLSTEET